jgi:hypothetical protein
VLAGCWVLGGVHVCMCKLVSDCVCCSFTHIGSNVRTFSNTQSTSKQRLHTSSIGVLLSHHSPRALTHHSPATHSPLTTHAQPQVSGVQGVCWVGVSCLLHVPRRTGYQILSCDRLEFRHQTAIVIFIKLWPMLLYHLQYMNS